MDAEIDFGSNPLISCSHWGMHEGTWFAELWTFCGESGGARVFKCEDMTEYQRLKFGPELP